MVMRRPIGPIRWTAALATVSALAIGWQLLPAPVPSLTEVARAFVALWSEQGFAGELATSLALNLEAIAWSTAITLALAYLTVAPGVRPLVAAVSKLRFTGIVGWAFVFALITHDGHQLKVWMLVLGMTPFFVTSMAAVIAEIPQQHFDHARSLGMGEWRVLWEVVIRGTLDRMLEVLRHNAAIGWMMLTAVEGIARGEGGVGVVMMNANKHLQLAELFAVIFTVLAVGVLQDHALAAVRRAACPYANDARNSR